ncbi:MAG: DoxX family protein [Rhodobacteraceae bacterium]|nr:DoxX family protein [Paracoccaceae bacterium]
MLAETTVQKVLLFLFRVSIGWVLLGAGLRQVPNAEWTAAGFLGNSPNLPGLFGALAQPPFIGIIDVLVPWAHLLIGLALVLGLFMRLSAVAGGVLLFLYYIPRFEFPAVVDYHIVYVGLLIYLATVHAGRIYGLERWLIEGSPLKGFFDGHPTIRAVAS